MENSKSEITIEIINETANETIENYGTIFYCKVCQDIPEFIFDKFPLIKVICKKADHAHYEDLKIKINNKSKDECKKNIDNIIQLLSHTLFVKIINNAKINANDESNLQKISKKDIEGLNLFCQVHKLPFKYYCNECEEHQCKKCRFEDLSKEKCQHKNCIDFIQMECDIKEQIKEIYEIMNSSNIKNKSMDEYFVEILKKHDIIDSFKTFVDILINHYNKFKHYTIIKNISNLYRILSIGNKKEEKKDYEMDVTKVFSPFRLYPNDKEKITEIKFSGYCVNMKIFEDKFDFSNLIKLSLKNNNISDISVLTKIEFDNLEKLNLNTNQLDDDMIDNFENIKAENLKSLNLSFNYFTNFKLFKAINKFQYLEIFKLESNPFDEEVDINTIKEEYNFYAMRKLYLSNGIFSNETVRFLTKCKFGQLEVLDISGNNIESLNFLHDLQFVNENQKVIPLKKIYLNNGDITDMQLECFKELQFPNLEKIEIKNNLIKKSDSLIALKKYLEKINKNCEIIAWENPIEN